jgi:hypothetical protein
MEEKSARAFINGQVLKVHAGARHGMRLRMTGKPIVGGSRSARIIFKKRHTSNTGRD